MLIAYDNGTETFVVDSKNENKMIESLFNEQTGRDIQLYDRTESDDVIFVGSCARIECPAI